MRRVLTAPFNKSPLPQSSKYNNSTGSRIFGGGTKNQLISMQDVNSTVYAIVTKTAESTSLVNWHLFRNSVDQRRNYGPSTDTRIEIRPNAHQAAKVWMKPNPYMTQQEFIETGMQHFELSGEWDWIIEFSDVGHFPVGIWIARPDRIQVIPDPIDYIKGYVYTSPDGERIPLDPDQVVQIKRPAALDLFGSSSPLSAVMPDIKSARNAVEWNNKFYQNNARPAGIIEVPATLSDKEFTRLQLQWRENHQGINNAFRVGILEGGAKFTPYENTQKDQQYIQSRDQVRDFIREAWTFPKPMLGATDDVNRANADAAEYVYGKWYIDPRLMRIKQALNNDFLPLFGSTGENVEFDYDCPIPEDLDRESSERTSKASAFKTLIDAGVDAEEAAIVAGLPVMKMAQKGGTNEQPPSE